MYAAGGSAPPGTGLRSRQGQSQSTLSDMNVQVTHQRLELESVLHPELRNDAMKKDEENFDRIAALLRDFLKNIETMEHMISFESQKTVWSKRVASYRQDHASFAATLELRRSRANRKNFHEEQRHALFGNRDESEVLSIIGDIQDQNISLGRSNTIASETIAQAVSILDNLKQQGSTLRRAQDKLKDLANVLGLSNSLVRVIERREWGDAMIVYAGMVFTVLLFIFVYSIT